MQTSFEAKGAWFVSLRAWLDANAEAAVVARIVARVPEQHRASISDPMLSVWYPEEALACALRALDAELTHGDRDAFIEVVDACTAIGISRFFKVLLRVAAPGFVLRQVPTLWNQLRRGPALVRVVPVGTDVELRYTEFPYFAEPLYELVTIGSVRALMRTCTGKNPTLAITERGPTHQTVRVRL